MEFIIPITRNYHSSCMYYLSSAKNYFSLSVLHHHERKVIIFYSSLDISKSWPIKMYLEDLMICEVQKFFKSRRFKRFKIRLQTQKPSLVEVFFLNTDDSSENKRKQRHIEDGIFDGTSRVD